MENEFPIFISYASEDLIHAKRIFKSLKECGANPWLDKECLRGGQKFFDTIMNVIEESSHIILLLSTNSINKKGFVQKEVRKALEIYEELPGDDIPFLIPVRIDECKPQHRKLNEIHWINMFPSWDEGFRGILRALNVPVSSIIRGNFLVEIKGDSLSFDIPMKLSFKSSFQSQIYISPITIISLTVFAETLGETETMDLFSIQIPFLPQTEATNLLHWEDNKLKKDFCINLSSTINWIDAGIKEGMIYRLHAVFRMDKYLTESEKIVLTTNISEGPSFQIENDQINILWETI